MKMINTTIKKLSKVLFVCAVFSFSTSAWSSNAPKASEDMKPAATSNFHADIQHWKTAQGTQVYFIENHVLPMIDIQITFRAGSAYDGSQLGLAHLTADLLNQGTQSESADQIADQFDMAGAIYHAAINTDMALFSLRTTTFPKQMNLALDTFKDVISHPTFPSDAFSRLQKQTEQLLKYQEQNPDMVARKKFFSVLYPQHPYAAPIEGTYSDINTLKREDAQKFYQHYYTANNAVMAIVGNLTLNEAKKISERLTSQLSKGNPSKPIAEAKKNEAVTQHISFPSDQTHIVIGQVALAKKDPDFFPLAVANQAFGGGMNSRLFKMVRGEEGLAYSVGSTFKPLAAQGPFMIKLQTQHNQTQKAVSLIKQMLNTYIEKGPSPEELTQAKDYLVQNFILKLSTNEALVSSLTDIGFYGLPLNYLSTFQSNLEAVTQDQIQKALKKHLSPERFALITVGKDSNPQ